MAKPITKKNELAAKVGRSERVVYQHAKRPGFPGGVDGPWSLPAVRAYFKRVAVAPVGTGFAEWKEALLREQHRRLKLKNDQLADSLLDRQDVEQSLAELILRLKTRLESIPDEVEMLLPQSVRCEVKTQLEDQIRLILIEMSQWELT